MATTLRQLNQDMNSETNPLKPVTIYTDSEPALNIAKYTSRRIHINVEYHKTREYLEERIVELAWIPTGAQVADVFTKPIPDKKRYHKIRDEITKSLSMTESEREEIPSERSYEGEC